MEFIDTLKWAYQTLSNIHEKNDVCFMEYCIPRNDIPKNTINKKCYSWVN